MLKKEMEAFYPGRRSQPLGCILAVQESLAPLRCAEFLWFIVSIGVRINASSNHEKIYSKYTIKKLLMLAPLNHLIISFDCFYYTTVVRVEEMKMLSYVT